MSAPDQTAIRSVGDRLLTQVLDHLGREEPAFGRPRLIGIDGRSGTGKSTLAAHIAGQLGATLVSGDDFFAGGTEVSNFDDEELADICIDRERLKGVLRELKSGRAAAYRAFDWDAFNGSLAPVEIRLPPRPILILEGVYATHPDLRPRIDLAVLIDLPAADRERRLIAREGHLGPWERQWHRAEAWYFAHLAPPDTFDLRVANI